MTQERNAQRSDGGELPQTYTKQDVVNQSLVAFGQGTNFMRVSSRACREFVRLMMNALDEHEFHEEWGESGVQVLERVRSIGRVVQAWAVEDGETAIKEAGIARAFMKVGLTSKTGWCEQGASPPPPPPSQGGG